MFRAKFVGSLASLQIIFLAAKGLTTLLGLEMSWGIVLIPVWMLVGIAFLFWTVLAALHAKFS